MIDARELRIGNLIYWNIPNKTERKIVHEVKAIINPTLHTCPISLGRLDENGYIGIQLTEEWLLKMGFVKKADISGYYFIKDKHRVYLFQDGKFEFEFNYIDGKRVNLFKTFQHVHQLQNLYFALTGEELTIKL